MVSLLDKDSDNEEAVAEQEDRDGLREEHKEFNLQITPVEEGKVSMPKETQNRRI